MLFNHYNIHSFIQYTKKLWYSTNLYSLLIFSGFQDKTLCGFCHLLRGRVRGKKLGSAGAWSLCGDLSTLSILIFHIHFSLFTFTFHFPLSLPSVHFHFLLVLLFFSRWCSSPSTRSWRPSSPRATWSGRCGEDPPPSPPSSKSPLVLLSTISARRPPTSWGVSSPTRTGCQGSLLSPSLTSALILLSGCLIWPLCSIRSVTSGKSSWFSSNCLLSMVVSMSWKAASCPYSIIYNNHKKRTSAVAMCPRKLQFLQSQVRHLLSMSSSLSLKVAFFQSISSRHLPIPGL